MVTTEDLTALLDEEEKPKPSYLIDKGSTDTEIEPVETENNLVPVEEEQELIETEEKPEGKYKCRYSNCNFSTDTLPELMTHSRTKHKGEEKPETVKERKKREKDDTVVVGVSEKEEKKILPESLAYLRSILKSFSAKLPNNILEGMANDPTNIELLKELLISSDTNPKSHSYIVKRYADYLGQPNPDESTRYITKELSPSDPIALLSKMRTDEITDTMYEKYKLANEERKVELDKKKRDLKEPEKLKESATEFIEYNEPIYTENGQAVVDVNGKPIYRKVKYNMNNLGMTGMLPFLSQNQQQKPSIEVELLKKEIEEAKKKIDLGGSSELNALKQQMLEMQRKHDEENRLREIREEARRDRDLLEKRIEEQNKRFEELIKQTMENRKPSTTEDTLAKQMMDMQRQYSEGLVNMQKQFQDTLKERETQSMFTKLSEELKHIKDQTNNQVGGLSETMKDFATDMTNTFEKTIMQRDHEKREEELKKKLKMSSVQLT